MPQLDRRGKWVFGWVVVGPRREIAVPPEARREYGFRAGQRISFLKGSWRSGGFSIARLSRLVSPLDRRVIEQGRVEPAGRVTLPPGLDVQPGDRLLVVRGSGYAPIFLVRGPIYDKALQHPELPVF